MDEDLVDGRRVRARLSRARIDRHRRSVGLQLATERQPQRLGSRRRGSSPSGRASSAHPSCCPSLSATCCANAARGAVELLPPLGGGERLAGRRGGVGGADSAPRYVRVGRCVAAASGADAGRWRGCARRRQASTATTRPSGPTSTETPTAAVRTSCAAALNRSPGPMLGANRSAFATTASCMPSTRKAGLSAICSNSFTCRRNGTT